MTPPEVKRDERGRILPGRSLNPGGQPRAAVEVRALLEQNTVKAAQRVIEMMDDADPKIALAAANSILDRVLGRAKQAVEVQGPGVNAVLAALITKKEKAEREVIEGEIAEQTPKDTET